MSPFHATPPDAEVIEVIRVIVLEGTGVVGDPHRRVVYYIALNGKVLARNDEWENGQAQVKHD